MPSYLVDRQGPRGYVPSGGPQMPPARERMRGMLPEWLLEMILGGMAPPAPPPAPPVRPAALRDINGMLTPRRPYFEHFPPPRSFPPRG